MSGDIKIGIDTGGTFTDFVISCNGKLTVKKVASTPDNPAKAIISGLRNLLQQSLPLTIIHGSTVATNTLLERKGARIALITSRGFEDVILIGRQSRKFLYNLTGEADDHLVSPSNCFGLSERTLSSGRIFKKISLKELRNIRAKLKSKKIEAVAIALINSYKNPHNETSVADRLRKDGIALSVSSQILPEYREFERTSTTVINAYVMPVVGNYLNSLLCSWIIRSIVDYLKIKARNC